MTRVYHAFVVLTCLALLSMSGAMVLRQRVERDRARAADAALEDRLLSLSTALGALAVAQRSNGESDARLFDQVQALQQDIRRNSARDHARFGVTVAAMGARR